MLSGLVFSSFPALKTPRRGTLERQGEGCRIPPCQHSGRRIRTRHSLHAALWQRVWRILVLRVQLSGWRRLAALLPWPDGAACEAWPCRSPCVQQLGSLLFCGQTVVAGWRGTPAV